MIGTTVGSFKITRQIGEGGMGRVYLAEHALIGKTAAIKILLPQYSADVDVVTRFFNEARASSLLKHPGVVDIYDFGQTADGSAFIVMEFLEGDSLNARLQREHRLSVELVVDLGRQVATALAAAHARGIVHRDLKPDNVFLIDDPEMRSGIRTKILDFGIAKLTDDARTTKSGSTRTGAIIGTPTYMSPEQCRGAGKVDHRTDIYALGCVMFEMATGRPPFTGEGPGDVLAAHIFKDPPSLSGVLPDDLAAVVARLLAKDPDARYQSMKEVVAALASANAPAAARSDQPRTPVATEASAARPVTTTTLGAASGEAMHRPSRGKSGTARVLAATVTVALAIAVAMIGLLRGRASSAHSTAPAQPAERAAQAPIAAAAASDAPRATAAKRVTVHLESLPNGADVFRAADGVRVGRTPLDEQFDETPGEAVFRLKLRGYEDAETSIRLDHDVNRAVALERVAAHRAAAPIAVPLPPPSVKMPAPEVVNAPAANPSSSPAAALPSPAKALPPQADDSEDPFSAKPKAAPKKKAPSGDEPTMVEVKPDGQLVPVRQR